MGKDAGQSQIQHQSPPNDFPMVRFPGLGMPRAMPRSLSWLGRVLFVFQVDLCQGRVMPICLIRPITNAQRQLSGLFA